jgi:hypothetical protein
MAVTAARLREIQAAEKKAMAARRAAERKADKAARPAGIKKGDLKVILECLEAGIALEFQGAKGIRRFTRGQITGCIDRGAVQTTHLNSDLSGYVWLFPAAIEELAAVKPWRTRTRSWLGRPMTTPSPWARTDCHPEGRRLAFPAATTPIPRLGFQGRSSK